MSDSGIVDMDSDVEEVEVERTGRSTQRGRVGSSKDRTERSDAGDVTEKTRRETKRGRRSDDDHDDASHVKKRSAKRRKTDRSSHANERVHSRKGKEKVSEKESRSRSKSKSKSRSNSGSQSESELEYEGNDDSEGDEREGENGKEKDATARSRKSSSSSRAGTKHGKAAAKSSSRASRSKKREPALSLGTKSRSETNEGDNGTDLRDADEPEHVDRWDHGGDEDEDEGGDEGDGMLDKGLLPLDEGDGEAMLTDKNGDALECIVSLNDPHTFQQFVKIVSAVAKKVLPLRVVDTPNFRGITTCAVATAKTHFVYGTLRCDARVRPGGGDMMCVATQVVKSQFLITPEDGMLTLKRSVARSGEIAIVVARGPSDPGLCSKTCSIEEENPARMERVPPARYSVQMSQQILRSLVAYATEIKAEHIGFLVRQPRGQLIRLIRSLPDDPDGIIRALTSHDDEREGDEREQVRPGFAGSDGIELVVYFHATGEFTVDTRRTYKGQRAPPAADGVDNAFVLDDGQAVYELPATRPFTRPWDVLEDGFDRSYSISYFNCLSNMDKSKCLTLSFLNNGALCVDYPLVDDDRIKFMFAPQIPTDA